MGPLWRSPIGCFQTHRVFHGTERSWPKLGFLYLALGRHRALGLIQACSPLERSRFHGMAKLPMVQRLAVLAAFQATVAIAYFSIIERSKAREGSFEKDGYKFWDMYGEPKHKRDQKADAEKSKS